MKRSLLVSLASVAVAAACQEVATSPQGAADLQVRSERFSNPPPPPIDTGASVSFGAEQASFVSNRVRMMLADCDEMQPATGIVLPVTYMFNPQANSGYIHFESSEEDSLDAAANGMVKMQNGVFSGHGEVTMIIDGCQLVIDLSSVTQDSRLGTEGCAPSLTIALAQETDPREEPACFTLFFTTVTLGGEDVTDARMMPAPVCGPGDTRPECNPDLFDPNIIT